MRLNRKPIAALVIGTASAFGANAYQQFSGVDINGVDLPLAAAARINSTLASDDFARALAASQFVGSSLTETFEGFDKDTSGSLSLDLGTAGRATLTATEGKVTELPAVGDTRNGRYSVPGGRKYWDVTVDPDRAGSFDITFDQSMAAFGFYGVDLGDFGGVLTVELFKVDGNGTSTKVGESPVDSATDQEATGSIAYFGLIARSSAEFFNKISFVYKSDKPSGKDGFAFDNLTVGTAVEPPPASVPEPMTLALVGLALAGLGLSRRRA